MENIIFTIDAIMHKLLSETTRGALVRGVTPSPGVVILPAATVRSVILQSLPHLDPEKIDVQTDATTYNIGMSPEGEPYIAHTNTKTGETTYTTLPPDGAIQIGINMLQFGTLAKAGWKPQQPLPDPTHDPVPTKQ